MTDSTVKTFFVIGNCQSTALSNVLSNISDECTCKGNIEVHKYHYNEDILKELDDVDYIVTQNIGEHFEGINTKSLLARYPKKVVRILNLHFEGYHPDWCYLPQVNGVRLLGPLGDYHNLTVLESFIKGHSLETAVNNMQDVRYNSKRYAGSAENSLQTLKEREVGVDIKMSDIIENGFKKGEVLFHTFNHPSIKLFNLEAQRILDFLNIRHQEKHLTQEVLNSIILRTNPICNFKDSIAVTKKQGESIKIEDFAKKSYELYENNPDFIEAFQAKHSVNE